MGLFKDIIDTAIGAAGLVADGIKQTVKDFVEVPSNVGYFTKNEKEMKLLMEKWLSIFQREDLIPHARENFSMYKNSIPFEGIKYLFDNNTSFSYATINPKERWEHPLTNYYLEYNAGEKGVLSLLFTEHEIESLNKMWGSIYLNFKAKGLSEKCKIDIKICNESEDVYSNYKDYKIGLPAFFAIFKNRNYCSVDPFQSMKTFVQRLSNVFIQEDIDRENEIKRINEENRKKQEEVERIKKQEEQKLIDAEEAEKRKQEEIKRNKLKSALEDF